MHLLLAGCAMTVSGLSGTLMVLVVNRMALIAWLRLVYGLVIARCIVGLLMLGPGLGRICRLRTIAIGVRALWVEGITWGAIPDLDPSVCSDLYPCLADSVVAEDVVSGVRVLPYLIHVVACAY